VALAAGAFFIFTAGHGSTKPSPTPVAQATHAAVPTLELAPTPTLAPTPDQTPQPFAITDSAFAADYQGTCDTDVPITGVNGTQFTLGGGTLSMRNSKMTLFCWGAKHTWMGTLTYAGYTFASDATDPLVFEVTESQGYLYVGGKGTVTLPNGTAVTLPL
jgi:hypothetical protein